MKFKVLILAIGFTLCLNAQSAGAGTLEDANAAIARSDYATARDILLPLAEQGASEAQAILAVMYFTGKGIPRDLVAAAKWSQRAAAQNEPHAQFTLGTMYFLGHGVPKDFAEAVRLYGKAADQGLAEAQFALGRMYRIGDGVPQDDAKAFHLIQKAADQGHAEAHFLLAQYYYMGVGVPEDLVKAYMWFSVAAATLPASEVKPKELSIGYRDHVAKKLTTGQIAEAQRLAREWMTAHPKP